MDLISIIVPMYNEEKNVKNCVDCLRRQTNQKFNVIFIDDGSTDETVKVLIKELTNNIDFSYEVLCQTNRGAAKARRLGIEKSKSEFVMIFDCDDKISSNMLEEFYKEYDSNELADIYVPNMQLESKDGKWEEFHIYSKDKDLQPLDCFKNTLHHWNIHGCLIMKKELIMKSYKYYERYNIENKNYINNDEIVTRINFFFSKKVRRINSIYFYCYNSESTTKKANANKYLMLENSKILLAIAKDFNISLSQIYSEVIANVWGTYRYMNKNKQLLNNLEEWNSKIQEILMLISFTKNFNLIDNRSKVKLLILKTIY